MKRRVTLQTTIMSPRVRINPGPIVWVSLFLTLALTSTGYALQINILDSQYTTTVRVIESESIPSFTRTQTSPVPINDSVDTSVASANAGLFGVSAQTAAFPYPPDYISTSSAFTESDLWFSPLTSQTTAINIEISAGIEPHFVFTFGNVNLLDITSGNEVWDYGWGWGLLNNGIPVPWDNLGSWEDPQATLILNTDLNASDTYELSMSTGSSSAMDTEYESIQLSGLEPIPEPSAFALIGLCSLVVAMGRFYKCFNKSQHPPVLWWSNHGAGRSFAASVGRWFLSHHPANPDPRAK